VALTATLVLLPNLGGPALWDEDEPLNAACSLAMHQTGDWVVPTFNGRLRIEKPALVNWLHLAGFAVAGPTETGARLPSALLTIGTCLLTWQLGCRLFGTSVGFWSGIVLATSVWTGVAGRAATPDAPLAFFTTLALVLFARGMIGPDGLSLGSRPLPLPQACAVGVACGLAMLAKGPVGLVLPMLAFLLFAGWRRTRPLTITSAALAVAGPWYVAVTLLTDGAWLRGFFLVHNAGRFTGTMEGHSGSTLVYYPLVLLVGLFPWSCGSALIGLHAGRTINTTGMRLVAIWVGVWLGVFSLSATKLPGYVWPAYPAIAVITGSFVVDWIRRPGAATDRWMRLAWLSLAGGGVAIAIGLPLAASRLAGQAAWLALIGVAPLAGGVACWLLQMRGNRTAATTAWAVSGCLTVGLLAGIAADRIGGPGGARGLVARLAAAAQTAGAAAPLAACEPPPSVAFYAGRLLHGPVPDLTTAEAVADFAATHPDGRLIVDASRLRGIDSVLPPDWGVLDATTTVVRGQRLVVVGRPSVATTIRPAARADFATLLEPAP
jgi:4-amino-4-deoxy-L-arabinose transferase-like glycosyltransferase